MAFPLQGAETVEFSQGEDVTATAMKLFRVLKNPILNSVQVNSCLIHFIFRSV
jgi:hypothetical protein